MSSLEEKTDYELKQMIFVLSKHDPKYPQIVKELFSRDIYDYRSTQEKQDKIEFDKLTDELFKKKIPITRMIFTSYPTKRSLTRFQKYSLIGN